MNDYSTYVAGQILEYIRDRLVIFMPYFNRALLYMPFEFSGDAKHRSIRSHEGPLSTDGTAIYADAGKVLDIYRGNPDLLTRIYLHMIMHCVFCHPFCLTMRDAKLFDFSADISVENEILKLKIPDLSLPGDREKEELIRKAEDECGDITVEKIYHYLDKHPARAAELLKQYETVRMDSHRYWSAGDTAAVKEIFISRSAAEDFENEVKKWRQIQQTVGTENLSYRKGVGEKAGKKRIRNTGVSRDDYDYNEFLRLFAADVEEVRMNPEEFDYIYYTYGLRLYENMPLIEPLEYRNSKKIQDFVIAIDTSGSCQGTAVRNFLNKTYSLLKNSEVFTSRMNVYIIQCDCEIQSEKKITSDEEFESYMKNIELIGAGGTDFTPVFKRVDELLRRGEFHDLRGLLYFTDGLGKYPEQKPSYKTAFIFVGREKDHPKMPSWADSYRF